MNLPAWPRFAATALLFFTATSTVRPQAPAPTDQTCRQSGPADQTVIRVLNGGGTVTVRSVPANALRQTCEVVVRDRTGKTIFEDHGFNTKIDAATGRDIDNDGQPDIVVGVDTAGGSHERWEFPIVSLAPAPRVLMKLPPSSFDFQTKPGKTLVWTSATFEDLGQSSTDVVTVATIHEFRANGFIDVTRDYCKAMLAGELQGIGNLKAPLATLNRQSKQESRTETGRVEDREDTRLAATTVALQQIYCGQFEDAGRLVLEVWPGLQQSRVRIRIRDAVADRWPDLAKQLGTWN